jgi:hypothetical protein
MCKCKRCGRILKNLESIKLGYGATCYRIVTLQEKQPEKIDVKELKAFITLEIKRVLKEFNFNRPLIHNNTENLGIIPPIKLNKIPIFDSFESDKRLVIKELKEQLEKGIKNVLHKIGSFDKEINFIEGAVGILA